MAPEMAVHVNAMVLLAMISMAVKLHFRSLPKSRNRNCGNVAMWNSPLFFFCEVLQLKLPKSLRPCLKIRYTPEFHGFIMVYHSFSPCFMVITVFFFFAETPLVRFFFFCVILARCPRPRPSRTGVGCCREFHDFWWFPKSWGYPKFYPNLVGFSIYRSDFPFMDGIFHEINHPAGGRAPFFELETSMTWCQVNQVNRCPELLSGVSSPRASLSERFAWEVKGMMSTWFPWRIWQEEGNDLAKLGDKAEATLFFCSSNRTFIVVETCSNLDTPDLMSLFLYNENYVYITSIIDLSL